MGLGNLEQGAWEARGIVVPFTLGCDSLCRMADDTVATITKGYTFSEETIELGVLMADGNPVPDAKIRIPLGMLNRHWLMGQTPPEVLAPGIAASGLMAKYGQAIDRDSAQEMLARKVEQGAAAAEEQARAAADAAQQAKDQAAAEKEAAAQQKAAERETATQHRQQANKKLVIEEVASSSVFKQFVRSAGGEIVLGIFGTALRK